MDNLLRVAFEAHNHDMNHHRRYEITIGRDLLDDWTVSIHYGRTGKGGRVEQFAGPSPEPLRAIVKDRLRRRLSAPKRIGCAYRLHEMTAITGFDTAAWLPSEVMDRFLN